MNITPYFFWYEVLQPCLTIALMPESWQVHLLHPVFSDCCGKLVGCSQLKRGKKEAFPSLNGSKTPLSSFNFHV